MDPIDDVLNDPAFTERYEIHSKLGEGGMGVVYRGVQRSLGRPVAIKFMHGAMAETRQFQERFLDEARVVANVIHTHVVAVFDRGVCRNVPYLVTELVEGNSLLDHLKSGKPLTPAFAYAIIGQVLSGLEALHSRGIIHRDLKPSNILVAPGPCAKVHDFGVAKQLGDAAREGGPRTGAGLLVGTPQYMSPEQSLGRELTPASDLYAVTVVLYEMITGHVPFNAPSVLEVLSAHVREPVYLPPGLPPGLPELIRTGMAKAPEDRFRDAAAYRAALEQLARGSEGHKPLQAPAVQSATTVTTLTPRPAKLAALRLPEPAGGAAVQQPQPGLERPAPQAANPRNEASRPQESDSSTWQRLLQMALLIGCLGGALYFLQQPAGRGPASSDPRAVRLEEVRESARRGKIEDAVRMLFALTRSLPELVSIEPAATATSELALDVDRTLIVVLESAARAAATGDKPPPSLKAEEVPGRTGPFFLALGGAIRDRDFARLVELTDAWLSARRPHGLQKADPDAASLHEVNAVAWLMVTAQMGMATEPWQVAAAVSRLLDHIYTHWGQPISYWSVVIEGSAVGLSAMPGVAAHFAKNLSELQTPARQMMADDGLEKLDACVEEIARTVQARWKAPDPAAIGQSRSSMLAALIIRAVAGQGWRWCQTSQLREKLGPAHAALANEVEAQSGSSFDLSNPPPDALLVRVAQALNVTDFGLIAALSRR